MKNLQQKVSIIGQGYVGFPLAIILANSHFKVIGYDKSLDLVKDINNGSSHIEDIKHDQVRKVLKNGNYIATANYIDMQKSSIFIVCVPTPLDQDQKPDLSFLFDAISVISKILEKGNLVIIESTVAPGTTRKIILPKLMNLTGLSESEFHLSFSPERIDPLNPLWNIKNTPKLVSGYTLEALQLSVDFYSNFIDHVVKVNSLEIAETSKLLENTYRLINISFINEMYMFCNQIGIDIHEVINAASTKPYGFTPFYPSIGIGGHCIPVDPVYLAEKFREVNITPKFIDLALQINTEMPVFIVNKAENLLGQLSGKRILVIGISYKPNVADARETPVKKLIDVLTAKGAHVWWHDDLVKVWNGEKSVPLSPNYDLLIVNSRHDYIDLDLLRNIPLISVAQLNK